jgi:uncharacterized protein YaiE (UPF0345 family)
MQSLFDKRIKCVEFKSQKMTKSSRDKNRGVIIAGSLVFATTALIIITGVTSWFGVVLETSRNAFDNERAFQIAEAGIDYYRWHLAHDDDDFQDGTGAEGPYVHDFLNKTGDKVGEFSLNIIPPENGTTVVTIESTGTVTSNPDVERTVRVKMAKPSFAKFAFVSASEMRFGEGTEVFGSIHSNGGIRFDGFANNVISSAKEFYDDPDHYGPYEFGVHTHVPPVDPVYPNDVPVREDVFGAGREFPVPAVDFDGVISNISDMKSLGQSSEGFYQGPSGRRNYGYEITLRDNDFQVRKVRRLVSAGWSCRVYWQEDWGTWSVDRTRSASTYSYPENGIMFFEDDVWVKGQIDDQRITIVAAAFPDTPSNRKSITVNEDVLYTNYDGQDVIALIAQKNVNVGMESENDLRIDAAMIAQNGRVGRFYYGSGCSPYHDRDVITVNGMIGSKERYGFAYTNNTGYELRNIIYDSNLLFGPPPEFPLTTDFYETISFEEVFE